MFADAPKAKLPIWKKVDGTKLCFDHTAHVNVMKDKAELQNKINGLITADEPSPNLNHLETCNVTDMSGVFKDKTTFNGDISQWDTSKVTTMESMFKGASQFNKDLTNWKNDVKVDVNTKNMFVDAGITIMPNWKKADGTKVCFDPTNHENIVASKDELQRKINGLITADEPSPNLNHLETCNVTDMSGVFKDKTTFNGDISQWDTSKVTTMESMFENAVAFNQPIGGWDVSKVTTMSAMFKGAKAFNQPISDWNVSQVTTMEGMFYGAEAFDQPIGDWNVSNVTFMQLMFNLAKKFNQPISSWNVSNVTDMNFIFFKAEAFDQPIGNWDVSKIVRMNFMFNGATQFCQDLSQWNEKVASANKSNMFIGTASAHSSCSYIPPSWY